MTNKRWCLIAGFTLMLGLFAVVGVVLLVDPFEMYHRAWFYVPPYKTSTQMYTNAGVARSYEYDSVIFGSSVTENCRPSLFDEALGGRFVKLCTNAGTARDHAKMMDLALRTHDVRRIVYGVDLFAFSQYYTNQKAVTPDYLYDSNPFNDVSYWFNRDVITGHIPDALSRIGTPDPDVLRDRMYFWNPTEMPGAADIAARVDLSQSLPEQRIIEGQLGFTRDNLRENVLPYVRANPDTAFVFFFPPYSMMYWADLAAKGTLETALAQKQIIMETLLAEPNVQLHDFQLAAQWTTDYDLYFDLIHYISVVNDALPGSIAQGDCRVTTQAQIEENIAALRGMTTALFAK